MGKAADGRPRQFYVGVGQVAPEVKLKTLVDLLRALQAHKPLTLAVCCNSRDSLDRVACCLTATQEFAVTCLFSDLTEMQRGSIIQNLKSRQAELRQVAEQVPPSDIPGDQGDRDDEWKGRGGSRLEENSDKEAAEGSLKTAQVVVVTDAVLKVSNRHMLDLPLILNYDLPQRKETLQRRISTLFGNGHHQRGAPHAIINFVVAGELKQFRAVEEFSGVPIVEMPMIVSDIFGEQKREEALQDAH